MSEKEKIWEYLIKNKKTTPLEIAEKEDINIYNVIQYINILKKAHYINHIGNTSKIQRKDHIELLNNTGPLHPTFSKGTLKDNNNNEEFVIYKTEETFNSVLKTYLSALIDLKKDEIVHSELVKATKEKWEKLVNREINDFASSTKRYKNLLLEEKIFIDTNNTIRNSPVFLVDLEKARSFNEEIKDKKIYGLYK